MPNRGAGSASAAIATSLFCRSQSRIRRRLPVLRMSPAMSASTLPTTPPSPVSTGSAAVQPTATPQQGEAKARSADPGFGQHLFLSDIPWDTYVAIGDLLAERPIRMTYDRGNLEIMTLS